MTHKSARQASFAVAAVLFACTGASAETLAANSPSVAASVSASAASTRFEVGSMLVERHGDHGSPIILLPGLASGAWVWADTVEQLRKAHVVYVVTLAGFDGRPAVPGKPMQQALQSLKALIRQPGVHKPVLIGHSLGGILAMALAQEDSALISGVVSIDGLPVFPGTEAMPQAQRAAMAERIKASMAGIDAAGFAAQQKQYMRGIGVLDAELADRLAGLSSKSDPAATAEYMAAVLGDDLRPGLGRIGVPVLLLSPYNPADGAVQNLSEADKTAYYRSLLKGTPNVDVVSIAPSRHFAMFDQPGQVGAAIEGYLKNLSVP